MIKHRRNIKKCIRTPTSWNLPGRIEKDRKKEINRTICRRHLRYKR